MDRDQPDFDVVENVLGTDVDYATLVKIYGAKMLSPSDRPERYYSDFDLVAGNASDRKTENHGDALAIYFVWHNFTKIQNAHKLTPAMAAGVTDKLWTVEDIVALVDSHGPGKRGSQRKRATS